MELGQRIKQLRLEQGLSQRQLCGDVITRNMLSQIENGAARPSMDTLAYLAGKLGKSVSYFLEEDTAVSANRAVMDRAREAFDGGDYAEALAALEQFRLPDPVYERERALLEQLCLLGSTEAALREGRNRYAAQLLERAEKAESPYCAAQLRRQRLLLAAEVRSMPLTQIAAQLPSLDEELMVRAECALETGDPHRAAALLEGAQERTSPRWNLLRAGAEVQRGAYAQAITFLRRAEDACPEEAVPLLERCFRELGDYQKAYHYACLQKK